ncbi:MAG TPA: OmpA family protein [Bacteroidales bacterium]|nr:OmpA family protein [Bacteroidales bacterium]HPT02724.1 OmpA family protein [Bacteroidales bacterium]
MNRKYLAWLLILTLAAETTFAQVKKADRLYKSYSYALAIPYYLKIAQKPGHKDRDHAIIRLADCYRLTNDQLNAKAWYSRAVNLPSSQDINWFYYGQALRCTQDYDMAREAYEKYAALVPDDPRGKAYAGFCTQIDKLNDIPAAFEIKNANNLNSVRSDFGPAFYGDGIVYASDRRQNYMDDKRYEWTNFNYLDLFFSSPKYLDQFFQDMSDPKSFSGKFNQTYHDGPATFACHDSLMYFSRTEIGNEKRDEEHFRTLKLKIFWAQNKESWSTPEPFFANSNSYSVGHPSLTPDGKTLYFVSDMPGGFGGTDIYCCNWQENRWSEPVNLGEKVNSFGNEMFPFIDGDTLYFASDGFPGFGGLDVFRTSLSNGNWSVPENLGAPVNSSFDDFSFILDKTGKAGFFASARPGGLGSDDIYAFRKLPEKEVRKKKASHALAEGAGITEGDTTSVAEISGIIRHKETLQPLAGSTVFLLNTNTGKVKVIKADENGQFKSLVSRGVMYVAKAMKNNYLSDCLTLNLPLDDTASKVLAPRDFLLDSLSLNKVFRINNMDYQIENIYYDFNKYYIRPDAAAELDKLVQVMKENPVTIELGSHTDCRGSKEYNFDLSQKRAESAVRYIVLQGIEAYRITAKGYGESQPVNHCTDGVYCTPEEHQANRRTEFRVTGYNHSDARNTFDMDKFIDGETIPVYMFDRDFFINCLQDKLSGQTQSQATEASAAPGQEKAISGQDNYVTISPVKNEEAVQPESVPEGVNITYRVQVFALSKEKSLSDPEFYGLDDIMMYRHNGLYKYTSGVFNSLDEAHAYRDLLVSSGFDDAFVVTFVDGNRLE